MRHIEFDLDMQTVIIFSMHVASLAMSLPPLLVYKIDYYMEYVIAIASVVGVSTILTCLETIIQDNRIFLIYSFFALVLSNIVFLVGFIMTTKWYFAGSFVILAGSFPFSYSNFRNCTPLKHTLELTSIRKGFIAAILVFHILACPFFILPPIKSQGSWFVCDLILACVCALSLLINTCGLALNYTVYHVFASFFSLGLACFTIVLVCLQAPDLSNATAGKASSEDIPYDWIVWVKIPICVFFLVCFTLNVKVLVGSLEKYENEDSSYKTDEESHNSEIFETASVIFERDRRQIMSYGAQKDTILTDMVSNALKKSGMQHEESVRQQQRSMRKQVLSRNDPTQRSQRATLERSRSERADIVSTISSHSNYSETSWGAFRNKFAKPAKVRDRANMNSHSNGSSNIGSAASTIPTISGDPEFGSAHVLCMTFHSPPNSTV
ncbi:unnamed protein product [Ambrosiozyma monospora]|uniref:Unnamed protein product n=1 Tax=Ambrosiozyma monospora TaxID=43982 RepID=A0A9W6YTB2_AMBMO|nr:unnamed protein product [Ambrosiozyma monospora]